MSMIGTLLAFVVFPLKAKLKEPAPPIRETWEAALDHWRNAYQVLWRENERLRVDSLRLIDERDELRRQLRIARMPSRQEQALQAQQLAQYQGLGQLAQQQLQQLQQNAFYNQQAAALAQSQQNLGAFQDHCNCVPSRGDLLRR